MFSKTVLLFLFGVATASSQFIPKLSMLHGGCPPAPELAPMICKLTQNIGMQYKPQLIAPSTYIPPLVVEKCDTPQLQMEINLPLTVEKKPTVIPAPPVLPPITLPKFPVPVMIEKPIPPPMPVAEPCEPALVPEIPAMSVPVMPELPPWELSNTINEIDFNGQWPMVIPQAPQFPTFVMPELPVRVPEPAMIVEPCPEDKPMEFVPVPEYVKPLVPIPAAPELPPARLPELPIRVEIPTQPIAPLMIIEKPLEEPCITGETMVSQPLAPIPAAPQLPLIPLPELPVRVEIPPQPILPPMMIEQSFEEPCLTGEVVVPQSLPTIPAAPILPATLLPELPVRVEIPPQPILPPMIEQTFEEPCLTGEVVVTQPLAPIPAAPLLPSVPLPELPVHLEIPPQPILPPMIVERPVEDPCITGDIVLTQPMAPLPVAPELPVRVEMPAKPNLPPMMIERPIEEPCVTGEMAGHFKPIFNSQPPKVPHFIMPEPQMEIMRPMAMPFYPAYPQGSVIADPCEPSAEPIVKMTGFLPYFTKHSPSHVSFNNKKFKEHMMPTMAINGFRPMKNIQFMSIPYAHRV